MDRKFTLGSFAAHMIGLGVREVVADREGRGAVGIALEHLSKSYIGNPSLLQPALAPSTLKLHAKYGKGNTPLELTEKLKNSIGWQHEGRRETTIGTPMPYAIYHELEAKVPGRPPQRSFLAAPARAKDDVLFRLYGRVYRMTLSI